VYPIIHFSLVVMLSFGHRVREVQMPKIHPFRTVKRGNREGIFRLSVGG
jgi:hypothetical protein